MEALGFAGFLIAGLAGVLYWITRSGPKAPPSIADAVAKATPPLGERRSYDPYGHEFFVVCKDATAAVQAKRLLENGPAIARKVTQTSTPNILQVRLQDADAVKVSAWPEVVTVEHERRAEEEYFGRLILESPTAKSSIDELLLPRAFDLTDDVIDPPRHDPSKNDGGGR